MNHADHVALIRDGVTGSGPAWLELGGGDGAFTLALADVLAGTARITGVDRDGNALDRAAGEVTRRYPGTVHEPRTGDFTRLGNLPDGPFDGILAANSLHFVRADHRWYLLAALVERLVPGGRLVVVEYDADRGNAWVPHPFSFETWRTMATDAGLVVVRLLHRVPSRFLGGIYGAVSRRPGEPEGGHPAS
jgi:ubiquinone/menaquinone biosynthesis C-methylase UbiE